MSFKNPRQITKYQTDKKLIEFNDKLSPAAVENASRIHAGWSKINVVGIDYTEGKKEKAVVADINIDPITVKYLYSEVSRNEKNLDFTEQKVLANKLNAAGEARVTVFSVKYNDKMRYPWNITIENGVGKAETQTTGGTALQKGTYRKEKRIQIVVSDVEFKKILQAINDYVYCFEQATLPELLRQRDIYEQKNRQTD